jgi:hypothetical protein
MTYHSPLQGGGAMAPTATNQSPQPIIDLILADINAVIPNFTSMVSSYRLLVGAAEEISRTPNVCPDVFERSVRRFDNAGTLIDVFLELLCCKIVFSSEFLQVSCAPVDLFRLISNPSAATDTPFHTAEQVIGLELLRKVLEKCQGNYSCLPKYQVVCPPPPPETPPTNTPPTAPAFRPEKESQAAPVAEETQPPPSASPQIPVAASSPASTEPPPSAVGENLQEDIYRIDTSHKHKHHPTKKNLPKQPHNSRKRNS